MRRAVLYTRRCQCRPGTVSHFLRHERQWSSFSGAQGFVSSTIFSTNNTKQASLAFAEYIADGDRGHFKKVRFYVFTLLAFHFGAAVSFFAVRLMGVHGAWVNIILAAVAYYMVLCENKYNAVKA